MLTPSRQCRLRTQLVRPLPPIFQPCSTSSSPWSLQALSTALPPRPSKAARTAALDSALPGSAQRVCPLCGCCSQIGLNVTVDLQAPAWDTPRRQRSSSREHASPLLTALRLTTLDYAPFSLIRPTQASPTHTPKASSLVRVILICAGCMYQCVHLGCVGDDVYVDVPRLGNFTNCDFFGEDASSEIDCGNSEFTCCSGPVRRFQLNGRTGTLPYGERNYIYACCT
jgi:hypothetical protein